MTQRGLLLINLGTPDEPTAPAVRRYLREFLSDPRVIDIHPIGRALLLELVILPFRPARSAQAYRKIWDPQRGSPLLYHSEDLARRVADRLGPGWRVELAMRYQSPSIASAVDRLVAARAAPIVVFPLYPQYSAAATGSTLEEVFRCASARWVVPDLASVPPFYDDPEFIESFLEVSRPLLASERPDHVVFSYHGLPERHVTKADPTGAHCLSRPDCCDAIVDANRGCYRAHCFATTRALASGLGLPAGGWDVTFQSRLGRTPWIQPFTDVVLPQLARRGKKRVLVFSAAFVADCLETLEEIAIRAAADFKAAGGESLTLVPSLNATPRWVEAVARLAERTGAGATGG